MTAQGFKVNSPVASAEEYAACVLAAVKGMFSQIRPLAEIAPPTWRGQKRATQECQDRIKALEGQALALVSGVILHENVTPEYRYEIRPDRVEVFVSGRYEDGSTVEVARLEFGMLSKRSQEPDACTLHDPMIAGFFCTINGDLTNKWFCRNPAHHPDGVCPADAIPDGDDFEPFDPDKADA